MILTFSFVFGIQEISAQAKGKVIYTQGAMTRQATLQGSLSKKKWMYFVLDFSDGKPAFNIVGSTNLSKFEIL